MKFRINHNWFYPTGFTKYFIVAGIIILYILPSLHSYAQLNPEFIRHLSENKLQKEHHHYLFGTDNNFNPDSLNFYRGKYYLEHFNDSLFLLYYQKSRNLFALDTCSVILAGIKFLPLNWETATKWFKDSLMTSQSFHSRLIYETYRAGTNPFSINESILPETFEFSLMQYRKYYSRKSLNAALLSAIVPGAGKLYAGRKKSFYATLFSHLGYGIQNYETITKLGLLNPYSAFNALILAGFYTANIAGSYYDIRTIKKEYKYQFLINAASYYSLNCNCSLY